MVIRSAVNTIQYSTLNVGLLGVQVRVLLKGEPFLGPVRFGGLTGFFVFSQYFLIGYFRLG